MPQKNTTMPLGCQLMGSALRVFDVGGDAVLLLKDLSIIDLSNFAKRCYYVTIPFIIRTYTVPFVVAQRIARHDGR